MKKKADIGIIGLAVMGENLALNMESRGFTVAVHNRTVPGVEEGVVERFMAGRGKGKGFIGEATLEGFVKALASPRKVMMMVKAGKPVDELIERLAPLLDRGDILIDGGNSHFADTVRRARAVEARGLLYIGTGVSGGEEGALRGPSIMPGGSLAAWPAVRPIFQAIAAKAPDGTPCAEWLGPDGAGHFVKMVHNGIEYGDMQLIAEAYELMKKLLGMSAAEMSQVFRAWNGGELESYLVSITADILAFKDKDGRPLVDKILDTAGQKGTGKWASTAALDLGVPLTLISEAVFARCLSAAKEERVAASKLLAGPAKKPAGERSAFLADLEKALYAAKIVSYAQGFSLLREAAGEFRWDLDYGGVAMLWRGGCIIRSAFLGRIKEAFGREPKLANLLLDPFFRERVEACQEAWRRVVAAGVTNGVWVPAMASGLNYLDGLRSARLPANLLQAQRDYFGAHTYERVDRPRGEFFHTDWTGRGGQTASGTYNV
ncbi:MAG TPA: decarboxylating NADP(+)-dependent phosphogluconate dehydrogenase [Burkholderiales bacterium]|nr:decarboxylating NADP(+)-dependent phosphogluconate dehydrogenase [Burkholderiales bacterium]